MRVIGHKERKARPIDAGGSLDTCSRPKESPFRHRNIESLSMRRCDIQFESERARSEVA